MGLFIGDYIPIQSISIDKMPLTPGLLNWQ